VSNNEKIVEENAAREFLKRVAEMARGDTARSLRISEIWDESFPIRGITREAFASSIVQSLKQKNLLTNGNSSDEVKIAYDGIYHVSDENGIPPESLGILSKEDMRKFVPRFLEILYEETRNDPSRSMNIYTIRDRGLRGLEPGPIRQISDFVRKRGWVEKGNKDDEVKIRREFSKSFSGHDRTG
jgi:hypothetical protein